MSRICRALAALSLLSSLVHTVSGAAIPPREDTPIIARSAIAVKLDAATAASLQSRNARTSPAQLIQDLITKAAAGSTSDGKRSGVGSVKVAPLFSSVSTDKLAGMVQQAVKNDPTYVPVDFGTWFQVQFPQSTEETSLDEIAKLLKKLGRNKEIASCQRLGMHRRQLPAAAQTAALKPNDDPLYSKQGYLQGGGQGINAAYAWGFPGGDGAGTTVIDVERGWQLDHEDLVKANITLLSGQNFKDRYGGNYPHGTAVLGEMLMVDNKIGGIGIVPNARGHVVGVQRTVNDGPVENPPDAIVDAASYLKVGDVMLLEMQTADNDSALWPIEVEDAEFDAIRLATAMGITVIEPAGNGDANGIGVNLDGPVVRLGDNSSHSFLNPKSKDFRDSGAILVGAGSAAYPRNRTVWSNYGSRVDVHAWGEHIWTSSVNVTDNYSDDYIEFDGTSGAAPIIAGAALSVQGMVYKNRGKKLSGADIRKLIKVGGTATINGAADKIGVMPDLKALIDGGYLK